MHCASRSRPGRTGFAINWNEMGSLSTTLLGIDLAKFSVANRNQPNLLSCNLTVGEIISKIS
jgi:hypothetical protein